MFLMGWKPRSTINFGILNNNGKKKKCDEKFARNDGTL